MRARGACCSPPTAWPGCEAFRNAVAQAEREFRASVGDEIATVVTIGLEAYAGGLEFASASGMRGATPGDSMRILIAEDDQVLADALLRSLRTSGAAVDHVASGIAGRRRADDQQRVRPADPRPRPAQAARPRGAAQAARARLAAAGADPDRGRQRRGARQGPGLRRRRLHGQALLAAGTRGARARAHAARHGRHQQRDQARPAGRTTRPAAWPPSTAR